MCKYMCELPDIIKTFELFRDSFAGDCRPNTKIGVASEVSRTNTKRPKARPSAKPTLVLNVVPNGV